MIKPEVQAKLPRAAAKGKEQDSRTGWKEGEGSWAPRGDWRMEIHRSQHQDTYLKQQKHLNTTFGSVP